MKFFKRRLSEAIEWRFRERLEAERMATVELGRTFVEKSAEMTDQIRLLESRVAELEKLLAERRPS